MSDRGDIRRRLVEMRDQLVSDLGCQIDGGGRALLADVQGLAAIDAGQQQDRQLPENGCLRWLKYQVTEHDGQGCRLIALDFLHISARKPRADFLVRGPTRP